MNLVVNFLSMLVTEEENGGVKRMLGVCSEFERIAKVVLDKAEKEGNSRRKRKSHDDGSAAKGPPASKSSIPTPIPANAQTPNVNFSPAISNRHMSTATSQTGYSPMQNGSPATNGGQWAQPDFTDSQYMSSNGDHGMTGFPDLNQFNMSNMSPANLNTFQQPFVPQDLWQMPMTLEWDWADMTGGAYPSFENGAMGEVGIGHGEQHL
jgi:hypothetical protein